MGELEWGDATLATPLAKASWGSQLDPIEAQEANVTDVEFGEGNAQPSATNFLAAEEESGAPSAPPSSYVMLDMCKDAAARLDIPMSRYERKTLTIGQECDEKTPSCVPRVLSLLG